MTITVKAKPGTVPALAYMSRAELEAIASSLEVVVPDGVEMVAVGTEAPFDTTMRWQETNRYGERIGRIKTYDKTKGEWL